MEVLCSCYSFFSFLEKGNNYLFLSHLWDLTLELSITTLGAESSGGTVYILNLSEPLDFSSSIPTFRRRISEITSFEHTVWTADCSQDQKRAVVGKFCTSFSFIYGLYHVLLSFEVNSALLWLKLPNLLIVKTMGCVCLIYLSCLFFEVPGKNTFFISTFSDLA